MRYMTFVASCRSAVLMQVTNVRRSRTPIYAVSGSQMEEFRQALPALSRSEIQVLLRELRGEGAIHKIGITRGPAGIPEPAVRNCNREGRSAVSVGMAANGLEQPYDPQRFYRDRIATFLG